MRALASSFLRDESGTSLIEFALFAPILAVMVMGISDVAMGYADKLELEAAAYRALEKVAVRTTQSDFTTLRAEAAAEAGVAQSAVVVDTWRECDRVRQTDITAPCAAGTDTARYVSVSISSSYTPTFDYGPLARSFGGTDGVVPISAFAAVRMQ
jgi:Flp pilus assembly protein TadG